MYRVVRAYTVTKDKIEFDDSIVIDIDLPDVVQVVNSTDSIDRFPGREQFLEDILKILEDEYHFDVVEDDYEANGQKSKGYHSDRPDSISVYFDTFYSLDNAEEPLKRLGINDRSIPKNATVECFIHFRFSDHDLQDVGDLEHRKFISQNAEKYTKYRNVLVKVDEEVITLPESLVYQAYNDALDQTRDELDVRILGWVRTARRYAKKQQNM